ncbi:hypothetical protein GCM10028804_31960 [Larkinella terrae]
MDLKASVTAWSYGKKSQVGQSDASGQFKLRIADSTQALTFEVAGYPATTVPVNIGGKMDTSARFRIHLPLIAKDSQQVVKTYPAADRVSRSSKTEMVYFRVQDARTFKRIRATVCFIYALSGRTQCVEVDSAKVPSFVNLNAKEKIRFEVRAEGYQSYRGELLAGQQGAEDALYQIKLLRLYNVLAVSYAVPANLKFQYEFRNASNTRQVSQMNVPVPFFEWNIFKPEEVYTFLATTADGQLVANETFRMKPGFNFRVFRLSRPAQSKPVSDGAGKLFDSTVLYFDQSDYSLRKDVRLKLDSISWQLIKQRDVMARLTGHTDNVGRRDLNMTLSEYRTRVVATYLQQKGISPGQLLASWKGSDAPAAPNTTEENKAKNRRVVIRFGAK